MALSKPLLITNKVNIWREVEADGAGIVVNDDIDHISEGLRRMLRLPTRSARQMGAASRHCFRDALRFGEERALLLRDRRARPKAAKSDVRDRSAKAVSRASAASRAWHRQRLQSAVEFKTFAPTRKRYQNPCRK